MKTLIVLYLAFFNVLAFTLMYADKRFAQRRLRRIPESVLMMSAVLGGSVGSWLGMYAFHHKTRKPRFLSAYRLFLYCRLGWRWASRCGVTDKP